jgi:hypothetical protein
MWAKGVDHLSLLPHFWPHPGGGGGVVAGGGWGKATKQGKSLFMAKMRQFIRQLLASLASEQFLPELKDVAFCMKILKKVNKITIVLIKL